MATELNVGWIDHSGENASNKVYLADVANDGSNYAAIITSIGLLKAEFALMSKLNFTGLRGTTYYDPEIGTVPADPSAQRETGVLVSYQDTVTGKRYSTNIPAPVDALLQAGTDVIDLANLVAAQFITVFEANCVSEFGNPIQVTSMRFVRRSR